MTEDDISAAAERLTLTGDDLTFEADLGEQKDVYSSAAATSSTRGVGTVVGSRGTYQRARRIAGILKRRRKKKRKKENEE